MSNILTSTGSSQGPLVVTSNFEDDDDKKESPSSEQSRINEIALVPLSNASAPSLGSHQASQTHTFHTVADSFSEQAAHVASHTDHACVPLLSPNPNANYQPTPKLSANTSFQEICRNVHDAHKDINLIFEDRTKVHNFIRGIQDYTEPPSNATLGQQENFRQARLWALVEGLQRVIHATPDNGQLRGHCESILSTTLEELVKLAEYRPLVGRVLDFSDFKSDRNDRFQDMRKVVLFLGKDGYGRWCHNLREGVGQNKRNMAAILVGAATGFTGVRELLKDGKESDIGSQVYGGALVAIAIISLLYVCLNPCCRERPLD